jgi:hypothetical protein
MGLILLLTGLPDMKTTIYMEMPAFGGRVTGVWAAGVNVPHDPDNPDWQTYQAFLNKGGTPLPFDPTLEWHNGKWAVSQDKVAAQREAMKSKALARVREACAAAIAAGFKSSALGDVHTYPSRQADQINLTANVLASLYPNRPADWTTLQLCADSTGHWSYLPHTAVQIQQVGADSKAAILACLVKKAQLQAEIDAATDIEWLQTLTW